MRYLSFPGILTGLSLTLSGCAAATVGTVQGMALNHTDKLASDHIVSAITGQDCNLLTYKETGKYCRSAAEIAAEIARRSAVNYGHCYRTRGSVSCFQEPELMATGETRTY